MKTPRNITEAIRQVKCYERAQEILADPTYEFRHQSETVFEVFVNGVYRYTVMAVTQQCTCPDWQRHQTFCKHSYAAELLVAEREMEKWLAVEEKLMQSAETLAGCDPNYELD